MRIAIGSDHTGYALRQQLTAELEGAGHDIADYGCPGTDSVDYPDIAEPLAEAVVAGEHDLGIVICSNGVGISIAANKIPGARAALCADAWTARRAREHTDCNILALGAYAIGPAIASEIVQTFISAEFEGGRHSRRLAKLAAIEERPTKYQKVIRLTDQFMYYGEEWRAAQKRGAKYREEIGAKRAARETGINVDTCKGAIQKRREQLGLREQKPSAKRKQAIKQVASR